MAGCNASCQWRPKLLTGQVPCQQPQQQLRFLIKPYEKLSHALRNSQVTSFRPMSSAITSAIASSFLTCATACDVSLYAASAPMLATKAATAFIRTNSLSQSRPSRPGSLLKPHVDQHHKCLLGLLYEAQISLVRVFMRWWT